MGNFDRALKQSPTFFGLSFGVFRNGNRRRLCRHDSTRNEARRPAGGAADQVRTGRSATLLFGACCLLRTRRNASRGPPPDYVFFFGRSARSSRNSPGPFRSRRFLCCCSSAVADGSASLSICWPARSMAFDVAFGLRRFMSCDPASPSSTSRRMASERSGLSVCLAAQASTFSRNSDESQIAVTRSRPVAGLPLFFRTTFLRDAFIFLVLPKEATTTCPKDRGRACGMGVHAVLESFRDHDGPRRSRRRGTSHVGGL